METLIRYLRRFGAWVTDLTHNYRHNPFVQATVNIIGLLFLLAILLIVISAGAIQYAQTNTIGSAYHIVESSHGSTTDSSSLPIAVQNVRIRTLEYVFLGMLGLIAIFALLLIRFALSPAREAAMMQKRFIGNIAHEVRTPLAIMKTSTEVALMDPNISADLRETLYEIIIELDRVSEIINNLLSFDTLLNPVRMKTELVDVGSLIELVLARHEELATSRNVTLTARLSSNRYVLANPSALEQVLTNIVKNAINYTPIDKGGTVAVSLETDYQGRVVIATKDDGIGISQKDLFHVFEPFYRGDTSRARGIGRGTSGLGLAIVNEIVRLHRGSISIKSATGQGTTVIITLPAAPASQVAESQFAPELDEGINEVSVDFS